MTQSSHFYPKPVLSTSSAWHRSKPTTRPTWWRGLGRVWTEHRFSLNEGFHRRSQMGYSSTTCLDSYHFKYLIVCLSLFCKYNICVQSCFSIHIIQILIHTWSDKTFKNTVVSVILLWKVSWIYAYVTLNLISNCSSQICWFAYLELEPFFRDCHLHIRRQYTI